MAPPPLTHTLGPAPPPLDVVVVAPVEADDSELS